VASFARFDFHPLARFVPLALGQILLQLAEPALRRANQIRDRRSALAHFLQDLLGGDAAVHQPDPFGLTVLGFDSFQEVAQSGVVRGVAWEHPAAAGPGKPSGVTTSAMTTCTQSERLSRL